MLKVAQPTNFLSVPSKGAKKIYLIPMIKFKYFLVIVIKTLLLIFQELHQFRGVAVA